LSIRKGEQTTLAKRLTEGGRELAESAGRNYRDLQISARNALTIGIGQAEGFGKDGRGGLKKRRVRGKKGEGTKRLVLLNTELTVEREHEHLL